MATSLTDIARSIQGILYSPEQVFSAQLDTLELISNGQYQIQDPTNPFVNLLEMSAMVASALKFDREIMMRRMFPVQAQTFDDLYYHMSDEDYIGRFSTPATTPFYILLRKDEVINKAVDDGSGTIRKLIIPRYTSCTIAGVTHTLSYPIELRVLSHGGMQIVYDTSEQNPLEPLEANVIDYKIVRDRTGLEQLLLKVPVQQYLKTTRRDTINPSSSFVKEYALTDSFYHCRAYLISSVGGEDVYREINTTHSETIYDITKPTLLLRVLDGVLRVEIPRVYFNTNMLTSQIRIDIYTTRGVMNMDLIDYDANAFSTEWGDGLESAEDSAFIAPVRTLSVSGMWSDSIIEGGTAGRTFEQQRDITINGGADRKTIITDAQLQSRLQLKGYDLVLAVDDMSSRIFHATRNLPAPTTRVVTDETVDVSNFITGAGCSIDTVKASMEELSSLPYVRDNGLRLTITPQALYQYSNGVVTMVPPSNIPTSGPGGLDGLVAAVNEGGYAYSPFYYVLDATTSTFECRPYHLDAPKITNRTFVMENQTSGLQIATAGYSVSKTATGYTLLVTTVSDDSYKALAQSQLHIQLAYRPPIETRDAFINGYLYGTTPEGEYVFAFDLTSELDITSDHQMYLDNFAMFSDDYRSFLSNLAESFKVLYAVSDYTYFGMQATEIDNLLGSHLLPETAKGLTYEQVTIEFGVALSNLWVNGRTAPGLLTYQTYPEDIYKVWPETQFVEDANGVPIFTYEGGVLGYQVLHRKGDPVIINGEPQILHRKGYPVLVDDKPVPITGRDTLRLLDIFLVDGIYYFASYPSDVAYKESIPESVVKFLRDDLVPLEKSLLQKTKLYFYPKKTIGVTKMLVGSQIEASLPAGLSFTIRHYLSADVYRDEARKNAIRRTTMETINRRLSRSTVSISDMLDAIKTEVGDDVLASDMEKMGPAKDIAVFSAIDDSRRCSVRRVLEVQPDQTLRVREDITVDFTRHKA